MDHESYDTIRRNAMRLADMALDQLAAEIDAIEVPAVPEFTEAEREAKALELLGQLDPADFMDGWKGGPEFEAQVRQGLAELERGDSFEPPPSPPLPDLAAVDRMVKALPSNLPPLTRMLDESELAQWLSMYKAFDPALQELVGTVLGLRQPESIP
jgi:hypothetical protein